MPTRILLADDHTLIRQGLRALLEKQGFQVVGEASDGQEALRSVEKTQPDVAIIDINMPVLNGVDAARELKKSSPKTKVMLLTQHDEDPYVTEALRAGVNGYGRWRCAAASRAESGQWYHLTPFTPASFKVST